MSNFTGPERRHVSVESEAYQRNRVDLQFFLDGLYSKEEYIKSQTTREVTLRRESTQLRAINRRLERRVAMDPKIPEILGPAGLRASLELEYGLARLHRRPFSLLFIDVDNFKLGVNDPFGHDVGDAVLYLLARSFTPSLRKKDVRGRIGGEEFMTGLPDTPLENAPLVATRISRELGSLQRLAVEDPAHPNLTGILTETRRIPAKLPPVTVSIGISALDPENPEALDILIKKADLAMYEAKLTRKADARLVQQGVLESGDIRGIIAVSHQGENRILNPNQKVSPDLYHKIRSQIVHEMILKSNNGGRD